MASSRLNWRLKLSGPDFSRTAPSPGIRVAPLGLRPLGLTELRGLAPPLLQNVFAIDRATPGPEAHGLPERSGGRVVRRDLEVDSFNPHCFGLVEQAGRQRSADALAAPPGGEEKGVYHAGTNPIRRR